MGGRVDTPRIGYCSIFPLAEKDFRLIKDKRMQNIRTRFAPSPTGYLHVGGARTALFNYLFAKAHGGQFILRIEDTDQERSAPEATRQVIESIEWLGLKWDEGPKIKSDNGPYYQSKRLDIYQRYLDQLLDQGKCYRCFCTSEMLADSKQRQEAMGLPPVYNGRCRHLEQKEIEDKLRKQTHFTYRFKVDSEEIVFDDLVRGKVKFDSKLIGDFVIRKGDGFPTYNFAVVVDDALMRITHVLRGDDHISNTPRQIMLYRALDFPLPQFCHISMILGADKEKLSKRHGATSVLEYQKKGYLVEPFLNFLALLGWSPEDGVEIIPRKKLETMFTKIKFSKSPAIFNVEKLDFLNGHYLRNLDFDEAFKLLLPIVKKGPYAKHPLVKNTDIDSKTPNELKQIVKVARDYCKKTSDINEHLKVFLEDDFVIPDALKHYLENDKSKELIAFATKYFKELSETEEISPEHFKKLKQKTKDELDIGGKSFFKPMRVAISGREEGVELDVLFSVLSRSSIIKRLKRAL